MRPGSLPRGNQVDRPDALALSGHRRARRRRHGRGLPGDRHQPGARSRDQGPAPRGREGPRSPRPLQARGASARRAQSPEHRRHLRARGGRREALPRARARAWRGHQAAARAGRDPGRRSARDRAADRRGARGGAQQGHRPPRPEAREREAHARRQGQGARLRPGQGLGRRGRGRELRQTRCCRSPRRSPTRGRWRG